MKQEIHLGKKFNVELVDKIKFGDSLTRKIESCKFYDFDFGKCGVFNFSVENDLLTFFYIDAFLGYMKDRPYNLVVKFGEQPERFVFVEKFNTKQNYPAPIRMSDFVRSLENFAELAFDKFLDMSIDFYNDFMEKNPNYQHKQNVPF